MKKNKSKVILVVLLIIGILFFSSTIVTEIETDLAYVDDEDYTVLGVDLKDTSLFLVSLILGLLDGFNPCAMWVLIYLITLVSQVKERAKMWFIVGTFLAASGIMYFIILAGWLNLFLYIGYSKWILAAAGIFAIVMGTMSVNSYIKSGGKVECEVGNVKSRKKTMNKMKEIVHSPITITSIIATIILAFGVNTIEFVCSAGLPAIFSQLLAIADVTLIAKYFYITVYTLAFMADDLLIFYLAFKAIDSDLMTKYSGISKLIGGIVMVVLGIILLFFPTLLM